jgi:hypothetical protein
MGRGLGCAKPCPRNKARKISTWHRAVSASVSPSGRGPSIIGPAVRWNRRADGARSLGCPGPRRVTAMPMRDLPDQGETEAGPGAGLSGTKKWSEDALAIGLSHAGTMVAYGHRCARPRRARGPRSVGRHDAQHSRSNWAPCGARSPPKHPGARLRSRGEVGGGGVDSAEQASFGNGFG